MRSEKEIQCDAKITYTHVLESTSAQFDCSKKCGIAVFTPPHQANKAITSVADIKFRHCPKFRRE